MAIELLAKLQASPLALEQGARPTLWLVSAPLEACPVLDYCLVEVVHRLRPTIVVDARWRQRDVVLTEPSLQEALAFAYKQVPLEWKDKRGFPYLLIQLIRRLVRDANGTKPWRLLLIHSPADTWWADVIAENLRMGTVDLQWERVSLDEGSQQPFCSKTRCPLLKQVPYGLRAAAL